MGNCVLKGLMSDGVMTMKDRMVKVVTSNGGIMELYAPITVECITSEFPGHGIFRSQSELFSQPLLHNEELHAGEVYYLLPLNNSGLSNKAAMNHQQYSFDAKDAAAMAAVSATPYRMLKHRKWSEPEVVPRYNSTGVWKVRLVISPEQLSEILSQESRTEALIDSLRTVAKCGNGASSVATSDQLSMSSSWIGSTSH